MVRLATQQLADHVTLSNRYVLGEAARPGARWPGPGIWGCQATPVGEGAGDGGGTAGDLQQAVDVFQVRAHGCLGYAQAAGDLGIGVPGGDQAQQVPVPGGEPGGWVAAALSVEVGLLQVSNRAAAVTRAFAART